MVIPRRKNTTRLGAEVKKCLGPFCGLRGLERSVPIQPGLSYHRGVGAADVSPARCQASGGLRTPGRRSLLGLCFLICEVGADHPSRAAGIMRRHPGAGPCRGETRKSGQLPRGIHTVTNCSENHSERGFPQEQEKTLTFTKISALNPTYSICLPLNLFVPCLHYNELSELEGFDEGQRSSLLPVRS